MKAALFGIVGATLAATAFATPAAALPYMGGIQPADPVQKTVVVVRRVVRGPRCDTIVNRRIGRFGNQVVTTRKRCY